MVKQIIKEAMDQNPLGLKEAVEEELRTRVALALEAKMDEMTESYDLSEKVNTSPEEAIETIAAHVAMQVPVVKAAMEAADLDPVSVVTAMKGKKTIKPLDLSYFIMGHAFKGKIDAKALAKIKAAADAAFKTPVKKMKKESVNIEEAAKWQLNPGIYKEAAAEELRTRVALALEAKMGEGFKIGDTVKIKPDASKSTLQGHKEVLRKIGKVVKVYGDGDLKVNFGGNDDRSVSSADLMKESVDLEEAFKVGTKVKVDSPKDEDHGKAGKIVTAKNGTYVVQFVDGKRGSFNEDELVNESVDLEEAITAQNKKDAEAVVAYAKQNRGKGIATTAGDNRIIPNIQIVRYLESIGKVKNVKELPSGKGWSFELKESVDLEEADKWHAKWQLNPGIYMVGGDLSYDDKLEYTLKKADSDILNRFLTKASDSEKTKLWNMFWRSKERGNSVAQGPVNAINYAKKALNETAELEEAKMTDAEVLSAAKALAANGKDAKTRAFGKGLVDFYKKEGSFTPAQVGGLQNIMKNASFQMAKDK